MNTPIQETIEREAEEIKGKRRLACAKAFEIAEKFGVTPGEVGKICETLGIKIRSCQLGCF